MGYRPDAANVRAASRVLLDPEQTAVNPDVANDLSILLDALSRASGLDALARRTADRILHVENERITNPTKATPQDAETAEVIDRIATSFAHGAVEGMDSESEDAAFRFLIQCRDDFRAGRRL
jgi:hypothetical protein